MLSNRYPSTRSGAGAIPATLVAVITACGLLWNPLATAQDTPPNTTGAAPVNDPVHWTGAEILNSDLSFEQKLSALNRQLALNPRNSDLYNNLGVLYADHDEWSLARDAFLRAIQADQRNAHNHRNLGRVFVELEETDMAVMEFETYRSLSEDGAFDAPLLIGGAWDRAGDSARAGQIYQEALEVRSGVYDEIIAQLVVRLAMVHDAAADHGALETLLNQYADNAKADLQRTGGAATDPSAVASQTIVKRLSVLWIQNARLLEEAERYVEAAELYEKILDYDPDRPDLLPKIAESWLNAGEGMKAKVIAQRAVMDNPDNPSGWKAKGRIADKQGRTRDALAAYEKVFELDPSQLDVASRIGQLYMTIGDNTSARRYMGVVASDPDTPVDLLFNYALSLQRGKEYALSIAPLRKVVERAPDMAPAWRALGTSFRQEKRHGEAEHAFGQALALEPDAKTAFQVGVAASRAGHHAESVTAYRAAVDMDPLYVKAWYNLSLAEIRNRQYEAALADLEVLGMIDPENMYRVYFNQGVCYAKLDRIDEAIEAYEMAIDIDETSAAWNNLGLVFQQNGENKDAARCFKIGEELKAEGR